MSGGCILGFYMFSKKLSVWLTASRCVCRLGSCECASAEGWVGGMRVMSIECAIFA